MMMNITVVRKALRVTAHSLILWLSETKIAPPFHPDLIILRLKSTTKVTYLHLGEKAKANAKIVLPRTNSTSGSGGKNVTSAL